MERRAGTHTSVRELVRLLAAIEKNGGVSQRELAIELRLSEPTITRLLSRARTEYGMRIARPAGRDGQYTIEDWGLFDREKVYAYLNAVTTRIAPN